VYQIVNKSCLENLNISAVPYTSIFVLNNKSSTIKLPKSWTPKTAMAEPSLNKITARIFRSNAAGGLLKIKIKNEKS